MAADREDPNQLVLLFLQQPHPAAGLCPGLMKRRPDAASAVWKQMVYSTLLLLLAVMLLKICGVHHPILMSVSTL